MKNLLIILILLPSLALGQLNPVNNINEVLPKWTTDQVSVFLGTSVVSGIVSTEVEHWTRSPILGALSGIVVGAGIGFAKDHYDQSWNTSIPNNNQFLNDTLAGGIGGAIGSMTLTIDLESLFYGRGRKGSVFKFGGKYSKYNARKFRRGHRKFLGIFKR